MARPSAPTTKVQGVLAASASVSRNAVSGNSAPASMAASAAVFKPNRRSNPSTDRQSIAKPWQVEVYRHLNICGEARYSAALFAAMAARAEIGVSEPQTLNRKAVWVKSGPEVDAFASIAPTVRDRRKLIADYMLHQVTVGECYLIARDRVDTDPGYGFIKTPLWEIVAVTELQRVGDTWRVRHDNGNYLPLSAEDPVIRLWTPDPEDRREAWSPMRSLLPTLKEIEWLTAHIFRQVRTRMMSAGVWFLPNNLTFAPPPVDSVEGGAEAIALMNEAEQFMISLAASGMQELGADEAAFPSIVLADPVALANIDQAKLIQFWSTIDDKAMILRDSAIRRFGLGMDLPTDMAVDTKALGTGTSGSGNGTNHWGEWAKQEQAISTHVEPALDIFVGSLTAALLHSVVPGTEKVLAYDTASLRMKQDRSKEAMEWYDRGILKADVALRETGFDPDSDMMSDTEFTRWLLVKIAGGSATPEQVQAAVQLLGTVLPVKELPAGQADGSDSGDQGAAPGQPGRNEAPSLKDHPYVGPPREQKDHSPAPFSAHAASAEALILRALEKAGNRLLNDGKRGRDKDRNTPPHMAHVAASISEIPEFDFTLLPTVFSDLNAVQMAEKERQLGHLCTELYRTGTPYTREALLREVTGL